MLVLTDKLWADSHIVKVHSSSEEDWNKPDSPLITRCVLDRIRSYMEEIKSGGGPPMILIIDLSKGCFPPWIQAIKIAKFFVSMKSLILASLEYTIIYSATEQQDIWLNRILTIYTPARPVHIVHSKKEIKQKILRERNHHTLASE